MSINTSAAHQDIVDNGEAALAADPVPLAVPQAAIGQDGGLVKPYPSIVLRFCQGKFLWMEEVPHRPVDYLVRRMAEDVDN
jgi:hypothetical protein